MNHALRGVTLADGEVRDAGRRRRPVDAGRRRRPRCRARGTWPGGATGSGSRWPASTSCGPSTRAPGPSRWPPAPPTRGCSTGRSPRRGSRRPPGWRADGRPALDRGQRDLERCATSRTGDVHTAVGTGLFDFGFRDGAGRRGAAPAPARRDRAARRVGRGLRHLQRRRTALAAGGERDHARDRPGRAQRRACVEGDHLVVVESGGAPAHPGPAGRRRRARTASRTPTQRPVTEIAGGDAGAGRRLHPAAGAEGRRPVRAAVAAARRPRRRPALIRAGRRPRHRPHPRARASTRPSATACCTSPRGRRPATTHGGEGAACHMHQQDWGVPVRVTPTATPAWCCRCPAGPTPGTASRRTAVGVLRRQPATGRRFHGTGTHQATVRASEAPCPTSPAPAMRAMGGGGLLVVGGSRGR